MVLLGIMHDLLAVAVPTSSVPSISPNDGHPLRKGIILQAKNWTLRLYPHEIETIRAESERAKVNEVDIVRKGLRLLFAIKPSNRDYKRTGPYRTRRPTLNCFHWATAVFPLAVAVVEKIFIA